MNREPSSRRLKTTEVSLNILQLVAELEGARVNQLADELDRPASTVHGHLSTLRSMEFLVKEGDIYFPGPELLRLGNFVHTRKEGYVLAEKYTEMLFEETNHRSIFVTEMGGRGVFMHTVAGDRMEWRHTEIGNRLYLHNTAVGKAILASMPEWRVDEILEKWGMPRETDRTTADREALEEALEEVRERGYAINLGENIDGLGALGVAAEDVSGTTLGAFSISGPLRIFEDADNRQRFGETLIRLIEEFELELALS